MDRKGIWVPQFILEDKKLDWMNKVLYAEILSLHKLDSGCVASNQHFATLLGLKSTLTAMNRIHILEGLGYLTISRGNQYGKTQRRLYPKKYSLKDTQEYMEHIPASNDPILTSIGSIYSPVYPAYTHEHRQHILADIPNNTITNSIIKSNNNSVNNTITNTENFDYTDKEAQNLIDLETLKKFGI